MIDEELLNLLIKRLEDSNKKAIEEANRKQSEDLKQNIKREIHELKEQFQEELNKQSAEYENKYKELKIKYEKLEKDLRKNNIIIFGLKSPTENLASFVINELNQHLDLTLTLNDINNVYAIGKQSEKRPIIVKLLSYLKKQEILTNSKKLKGTNISIAEELTREERKENKILRDHLKTARSKKLNAYIKNRKLIINGQQYRAQDLTDEEDNIETEEIVEIEKTREDRELYEARQAATRLNNSDPSTPTRVREEFQVDTNKEEDEVFEINKPQASKIKTTKTNQSVSKIVRTSNRINSNKEQRKIITNTPRK